MTTLAPPAATHEPIAVPRAKAWDRAAITALGAAGCALSYDALQQMAVAIHVRGLLTFLFPLVIDGFIAYGVRALIILRTAPFGARLYIWALFGTATTASIWANALHAVRLNHLATEADLRLGDATVGILSTLAPLALAGAVHLYILIARHPAESPRNGADNSENEHTCGCGNDAAIELATGCVPFTHPDDRTVGNGGAKPAGTVPESTRGSGRRPGRPPSAEIDELVAIGRPVAEATGTVSRKATLDAIRAAGHTIGNDRLKQVIHILETKLGPQRETSEDAD